MVGDFEKIFNGICFDKFYCFFFGVESRLKKKFVESTNFISVKKADSIFKRNILFNEIRLKMSTIFPLIFTVSHHVFHNIRDKKANIEIMFFYKMQKKTDMAIPLKK